MQISLSQNTNAKLFSENYFCKAACPEIFCKTTWRRMLESWPSGWKSSTVRGFSYKTHCWRPRGKYSELTTPKKYSKRLKFQIDPYWNCANLFCCVLVDPCQVCWCCRLSWEAEACLSGFRWALNTFFEICSVLNISWVSACLCGIFHNDPLCVRYLIIFRMFVFLHGLYVCCSNKIHSAKTSTRFLQVTWRSGDVHDWTSVIRRTVFCLCHPLHLNNALVCSECWTFCGN